MRSRTMREGSVGLLIILGLAVFGGLVVWLNRLNLSNRTYNFIVSFDKVGGMKTGATVRYRGVAVGKIKEVQAKTNGVDVTIEINRADLLIPRDATIEANQAGFIGETSIDIAPKTPLPSNALSLNPLNQCNSKLIICNQDRLSGQVGVSFDELLRYTTRLATFYSDPTFYNNVNALTKNATVATAGVAQLTSELSLLSRSARQQIGSLSTAANSVSTAAEQTTRQLGTAVNRIGNTADQFGNTATQLNNTAKQASLTAAQFGQLAASANELVVSNRGNLGNTLESVRQTSDQLRGLLKGLTDTTNQASSTLGQLNSTVGQVNSSVSQVKVGALVKNLETLSANAAQASANLRDVTSSLNNPSNALVLQQTLESARATFENAQKITSELDELTGDPAFRNNLKKLVNGLSKLVSSTDKLQEQVQIAQTIEPVSAAINTSLKTATALPSAKDSSQPKFEPPTSVNQENTQKQLKLNIFPETPLLSPAPKKRSLSQNSLPLAETEGEKR